MSIQQRAISIASGLGFGVVLLGGGVLFAALPNAPAAAEMSNYSVTKVEAPRLLKVSALHLEPAGMGTFYFTIAVPASYGKSIEAIRISQIPGGDRIIDLEANESKVVIGPRVTRNSEAIPLSAIGGPEDETGALTLAFAQPVVPGTTFTVAVEAERNPTSGGIYQFGVTVYPVGESTTGHYIGTGRVTFNSD
ncbi:DUF2808 domain-containing protein [Altericista sp. CCNU0014]|uniref:DUF2808 domain-containing protein n=1 Tax=Altericista sp. CCNU0014 TaxID=3082949 RepID=UPI00384CE804